MKSTAYVEFCHPPSLSGLSSVPQDSDTFANANNKMNVQPPTSVRPPLTLHLEQLRQAAQRATYTRAPNQTDRFRDLIYRWSAAMTPEQLSRRFTTAEIELLAGLVGKHGGRAAHHHIALALRSAGFIPCRDWSVAGRNRRYWKFQGVDK